MSYFSWIYDGQREAVIKGGSEKKRGEDVKKITLGGCRKKHICCVEFILRHCDVLSSTSHSSRFHSPYICTFSNNLLGNKGKGRPEFNIYRPAFSTDQYDFWLLDAALQDASGGFKDIRRKAYRFKDKQEADNPDHDH